MRISIFFFLSILFSSGLFAQINHGGEPISWSDSGIDNNVNFYRTAPIDLKRAEKEDAIEDQKVNAPYRFGIEHKVDLDFFVEAQSFISDDNKVVWRMGLECPDAQAVNMLFDDFYLPEGGQLFIYNEDKSHLRGAFTSENNKLSRVLPIAIMRGNRIIIEYIEPQSKKEASLNISQIVHVYRSAFNKANDIKKGPFGTSGECNININCPEGADWQNQKRSVALIHNGATATCTGALINNSLQNGIPYFLTANHCLDFGEPENLIFYFNHESDGCIGSDGPIDQTIAGALKRANNPNSDFTLMELSDNIPPEYDAYFSGWDNSGELTVTGAVGIHHPSGDVKKICFEEDAPFHNVVQNVEVWQVDQWELGVTEGRSSGSPLFDQNGRIIGQLFAGSAACDGTVNNGQDDIYGRFSESWDGSNSTNRLRDWLDPNNTQITTLDGFAPNDDIFENDISAQSFSNIPSLLCSTDPFVPTFTVRNLGSNVLTSATIEYSYNGDAQTPIEWSGSLMSNESEEITLASFSPISGDNTINLLILNPNGEVDDNELNNESSATVSGAPIGKGSFELTLLTDNFGSETSWQVTDIDGVEIAFGDGYESNTSIVESIPIEVSGCYSFQIFDSEADGICCGFGEGNYSLHDSEGNLLISGGDFGPQEGGIWQMEVDIVSVSDNAASEAFSVFPNPAENRISINYKTADVYHIELIDLTGRTLYKTTTDSFSKATDIDVSKFPAGAYIVTLRNETYLHSQKLAIYR